MTTRRYWREYEENSWQDTGIGVRSILWFGGTMKKYKHENLELASPADVRKEHRSRRKLAVSTNTGAELFLGFRK